MTEHRDRIVQLWVAHDDAGDRLAAVQVDSEGMRAIIDGARNPSSYDLAAIADAFGVTVAWLLTGDDHGLDEEEARFLREETIAAQWHRRAEKAEATLARVRELHRVGVLHDATGKEPYCVNCRFTWPCPTIQALEQP